MKKPSKYEIVSIGYLLAVGIMLLIIVSFILALFYLPDMPQYNVNLNSLLNYISTVRGVMVIMVVLALITAMLLVFRYYHIEILKITNKYNDLITKPNKYTKFDIERTIKSLNTSIVKFSTLGYIGLVIAFASIVMLTGYVFQAFENVISDAKALGPTNIALVMVIVVLRASVLGALIVTFVVYMMKFVTSSFDQAARFTKRKHGALFLMQMLNEKDLSIERMKAVMNSFKEWNLNIESAYTDIKFNEKAAMSLFEKMGKLEENLIDVIKTSKEAASAGSENSGPKSEERKE